MRINKFLAQATGISRRTADAAVEQGLVRINGVVTNGQLVQPGDVVTFDGHEYPADQLSDREVQTILLNKPAGYVVSRNGQGSQTIYDLLPDSYHNLKPVGRLDKESSGLLLLTDDGDLANQLTHPSHRKVKIYEVTLDAPLVPLHQQMINDFGIQLEDGASRLQLERMHDNDDTAWRVTMREGRNRQIRRTFAALGYTVIKLHRTDFGPYHVADLAVGQFRTI